MLRPNRSCSWRTNQWFIAIVGLQASLVGAFFWFKGLYLVLPFAGLETLAVAAAFYVVSRRTYAWEAVVVADDDLEVIAGNHHADARQWRFRRHGLQLVLQPAGDGRARSRLSIAMPRSLRVEIGRFLSEGERRALHRSLQQALTAGV